MNEEGVDEKDKVRHDGTSMGFVGPGCCCGIRGSYSSGVWESSQSSKWDICSPRTRNGDPAPVVNSRSGFNGHKHCCSNCYTFCYPNADSDKHGHVYPHGHPVRVYGHHRGRVVHIGADWRARGDRIKLQEGSVQSQGVCS